MVYANAPKFIGKKNKGQLAAEQAAITDPTAPATPAAPSPPKVTPPPRPPAPGASNPLAGSSQVPPPTPPAGPSPTAPRPPVAAPGGGASDVVGAIQDGAKGVPVGAPAPGAQTSENLQGGPPQEFNDAASQLLLQQLQEALNGADTAEEEELIRQQMEDAIGQQLVDARASMGRAGFGGGTLAALEGDIQRKSRQDMLGDILGLRRTEEQRAIDNALGAIGADIDLRDQAASEFFNESYLDALKSFLGQEPEAEPGAPAPSPADVGNSLVGNGPGSTNDVAPTYPQSGENVGQQQTDAGQGETIRSGKTDYVVKPGKVGPDDVAMPPYRITVDGKTYRTYRDPYGNPYVVPA